MGKLTDKVAKGLFWVLMEKVGIQGVHFVVTLVLARLLTPEDYGTVALLSIFISISNTFVDCGFGKALVRKKNATQTDFNSVFYLSMVIAAVLYATLFLAAPLVSSFYSLPELSLMLRILALSLIFHSINGVQNAELNRKMLFHLSFRISWVSATVKAVIGVVMAYLGYGAWALVWASIAGGISGVIARQFVIAWRPTLTFSWISIRELFSFGWKMTAAGLLSRICQDITGFFIGKVYSHADLAFYNKGSHMPNLLAKLIDNTLGRVSFSALVKLQDDGERLRNALRRMIRCSSFLICPVMIVMAVLAKPMVVLLYGKRWEPCAILMLLFCFMRLPRPLSTVSTHGYVVQGRSDLHLKIVFIRRAIGFLTLGATLWIGLPEYVATVAAFSIPLTLLIDASPGRTLLGYSFRMQLADTVPPFLLSLGVGSIVYLGLQFCSLREFVSVPLGLIVFFLLYGFSAYLMRMSPMAEFARVLEPRIAKRVPILLPLVRDVTRRCGK